jgi:hypothetical protein
VDTVTEILVALNIIWFILIIPMIVAVFQLNKKNNTLERWSKIHNERIEKLNCDLIHIERESNIKPIPPKSKTKYRPRATPFPPKKICKS